MKTDVRLAPRLTWGEEMVSVALAAWMVTGLFLDGWAHNHGKPETIFTPWHAVFYSGFLATAAHAVVVRRRYRQTPAGMRLVFAGLIVFGAGAAADLAWHSLFGIEVGLDALLSPTHLVMLAGGLLILSGPFRAHWLTDTEPAPSLRDFLPALLSLTLAAALVAFFFMYITPFRRQDYGTWVNQFGVAVDPEDLQTIGLAALLMTNVLYVAPLLLMLKRWRPPAGTATVLVVSMTALVTAIDGFERGFLVVAAAAGGLAADVLIGRLSPAATQPWTPRLVAAAMSLALWSTFFVLYEVVDGVGWSPELWLGAIVMATLSSLALGLLMFPPAVTASRP